ncbi:MAG: hypothetical protein ACLT0W_11040, partial [Clostridium sp.]
MSSKKPKMSKDKSIETLKRVLNYIAAYRWAVCLSLLLALVTVAFTLYIPILQMGRLAFCISYSFTRLF